MMCEWILESERRRLDDLLIQLDTMELGRRSQLPHAVEALSAALDAPVRWLVPWDEVVPASTSDTSRPWLVDMALARLALKLGVRRHETPARVTVGRGRLTFTAMAEDLDGRRRLTEAGTTSGAPPPSPHDRAILASLEPALYRRCRLELQLALAEVTESALEGALASHAGPAYIVCADSHQVLGCNDAGREQLHGDALRAALAGDSRFLIHDLAAWGAPGTILVTGTTQSTASERVEDWARRWGLSPRQREVLELLAQGRTNRHIAESLHISIRTAESHVAAVLRRAEVANRVLLVRKLMGATWAPLATSGACP